MKYDTPGHLLCYPFEIDGEMKLSEVERYSLAAQYCSDQLSEVEWGQSLNGVL